MGIKDVEEEENQRFRNVLNRKRQRSEVKVLLTWMKHTHILTMKPIDWQWTKQEATISDFIHVDPNFFHHILYICSITLEHHKRIIIHLQAKKNQILLSNMKTMKMMMMSVVGEMQWYREQLKEACTGELTSYGCVDVNLDHVGFQACDAYDKNQNEHMIRTCILYISYLHRWIDYQGIGQCLQYEYRNHPDLTEPLDEFQMFVYPQCLYWIHAA